MGYVTHTGVGDRNYAGTHTLHAVNDKGETGASIPLQDGGILVQLAINRPETVFRADYPKGIRYAVSGNSKDAFAVFLFAANNTGVEWQLDGYSINRSNQFVISTQHSPDHGVSTHAILLDSDFNLSNQIFDMHSHPKETYSAASGGDQSRYSRKYISINNGNVGKANSVLPSPHYIFNTDAQTLHQYDAWNPNRNEWIIRNSSDLRRRILR